MKKFLSAFFAAALIASPAFAEHHEDKKAHAPAALSTDVDVSKAHGDEHHKHEGHTHDATHAHGDHSHKVNADATGDAPVDNKDVKEHHDEKKTDDHGHAH